MIRLIYPSFFFILLCQGVIASIEQCTTVFQYRNGGRKIIGSAEHCLKLCHQNALIEGLCDKIICAHIHCHDHIHIVGGRGDKDNRHLGHLTDLTAPMISVKERQSNIQQNDMRVKICKFSHYITEVLNAVYLQLSRLCHVLYCFCYSFVVFNNQ